MLPAFIGDVAFTDSIATRMIECIAHRLEDTIEIARALNIPTPALAALLENDEFMHRVREARVKWIHPENTSTRTRQKADLAFEESLPRLHALVFDNEIPAAENIRAAQALREATTLQREREEARSRAHEQGPGGLQSFELRITFPWANAGDARGVVGEVIDADQNGPRLIGREEGEK